MVRADKSISDNLGRVVRASSQIVNPSNGPEECTRGKLFHEIIDLHNRFMCTSRKNRTEPTIKFVQGRIIDHDAEVFAR